MHNDHRAQLVLLPTDMISDNDTDDINEDVYKALDCTLYVEDLVVGVATDRMQVDDDNNMFDIGNSTHYDFNDIWGQYKEARDDRNDSRFKPNKHNNVRTMAQYDQLHRERTSSTLHSTGLRGATNY